MSDRKGRMRLFTLFMVILLGLCSAVPAASAPIVEQPFLLGNISLEGTVIAIGETRIVVQGMGMQLDAAITPDTVIVGDPVVGDLVYIEAVQEPSGGFVATYIEVRDQPPPGNVSFSGTVVSITETQIVVQDDQGLLITATITPDTVVVGEPVVGDLVYVEAAEEAGGGLTATYIEVLDEPLPGPISFFGVVVSITETQIVVQDDWGQPITATVTPDTIIVGEPAVGDPVYVEAVEEPSAGLVAIYIEVLDQPPPGTISFSGAVISITETRIVVQGQGMLFEAAITPDTVIVGEPAVDDWVYVEAIGEPSNGLVATYIEVLDEPPPGPISFVGTVISITETQIVVQDERGELLTATITPDTVIVGEPIVGDSVYVEAVEEPSAGLVATYIEVLDEPPPGPISFVGTVISITETQIVVQDERGELLTATITPDTVIVGEPVVGDMVYVEAMEEPSSGLTAMYIEVLDQPPPETVSLLGGVASFTDTLIVVADPLGARHEIVVTTDSVIVGDPIEGSFAHVEAAVQPDGSLVALYIEVMDCQQQGVVQAISDSMLTVDGQQFSITDKTRFAGEVQVGSYVTVQAKSGGGVPTAFYVQVVSAVYRAYLPLLSK